MRRYRGVVDNSRWERFESRPDDVVISTPSKCGTTWMQNLVGMIVLDRIDLGVPLAVLSPWLDVNVVAEEVVFERLDAQNHRRFVKTHTPLDGVPRSETWTYITVFRHPLDVALSLVDHDVNMDRDQFASMIVEAGNELPPPSDTVPPSDPEEYLRFWIDDDREPDGSGPNNLADYANSLIESWDLRHEPNVHLFHYDDMWNDLDGQMARLAEILGVELDVERRSRFVEAGTLDSMRSRANETAPYGDRSLWRDPGQFFKSGGRRAWSTMLTPDEIVGVADRLASMVGNEAAAWALGGGPDQR